MGEDTRNVILCGFMASGKSSVGKCLAGILGYEFCDLDVMIEADTGLTIPQIFSSQGEAAFRALESRMVERMSQRTRCVIATGGGTIVNPQNLENLKRNGIVVSLTADLSTILSRVGSAEDRPMLAGDKVERIKALMEQRASVYARTDFSVDTSSRTIDEVANLILEQLRIYGV
jgi:shikimate kinase